MKRPVIILFILVAAAGAMALDILTDCSLKSGKGAKAGYCNDPAGGNRTCTICHSGPGASFVEGLITSNIPVDGYSPDSTYTITATISKAGHSKFGFEASPQNSGGTFLGKLVNTGSDTQLTGTGNNYITHTSGGTAGAGTRTWKFSWTAPPAGSGEVTFYGAFLVTNSSNNTSGDTTYTSSLAIPERNSTGSTGILPGGPELIVYPDPAVDRITIRVSRDLIGLDFSIIDPAGRQVLAGKLSGETTPVQIGGLASGIYFLRPGTDSNLNFKFLKL